MLISRVRWTASQPLLRSTTGLGSALCSWLSSVTGRCWRARLRLAQWRSCTRPLLCRPSRRRFGPHRCGSSTDPFALSVPDREVTLCPYSRCHPGWCGSGLLLSFPLFVFLARAARPSGVGLRGRTALLRQPTLNRPAACPRRLGALFDRLISSSFCRSAI